MVFVVYGEVSIGIRAVARWWLEGLSEGYSLNMQLTVVTQAIVAVATDPIAVVVVAKFCTRSTF